MNKLPALIVAVIVLGAFSLIGLIWYFASPWYTDVGYQPIQPVEYSHKVHAGDLGMDCRYCHNYVETAAPANIPPTQTCMNCHKIIKAQSEKVLPVAQSWAAETPIEWIRVHKLPDYVYFDHSAHLAAGIGCFSCHGNVARMEKITQVQPLSMSWCLECHRQPNKFIRPREEIVSMTWIAPPGYDSWAEQFIQERNIKPPTDCSGCHR